LKTNILSYFEKVVNSKVVGLTPGHPVPGGLDRSLRIDVAQDLGDVHVRGVAELGREPVVLQDDGLEDLLEILVAVFISGVDAAVLESI
jgi:hypothetical protein